MELEHSIPLGRLVPRFFVRWSRRMKPHMKDGIAKDGNYWETNTDSHVGRGKKFHRVLLPMIYKGCSCPSGWPLFPFYSVTIAAPDLKLQVSEVLSFFSLTVLLFPPGFSSPLFEWGAFFPLFCKCVPFAAPSSLILWKCSLCSSVALFFFSINLLIPNLS